MAVDEPHLAMMTNTHFMLSHTVTQAKPRSREPLIALTIQNIINSSYRHVYPFPVYAE
jgi:hypothetical protein